MVLPCIFSLVENYFTALLVSVFQPAFSICLPVLSSEEALYSADLRAGSPIRSGSYININSHNAMSYIKWKINKKSLQLIQLSDNIIDFWSFSLGYDSRLCRGMCLYWRFIPRYFQCPYPFLCPMFSSKEVSKLCWQQVRRGSVIVSLFLYVALRNVIPLTPR